MKDVVERRPVGLNVEWVYLGRGVDREERWHIK